VRRGRPAERKVYRTGRLPPNSSPQAVPVPSAPPARRRQVQLRARSWVSSQLLGVTPVTQVPPMRTRPRRRRPGRLATTSPTLDPAPPAAEPASGLGRGAQVTRIAGATPCGR